MECTQDRLQRNFDIIFNVVCEYLQSHYGMKQNLSFSEVEDFIRENDDCYINEDFIEAIIEKLTTIDKFSKLEYKFSVEDYWLDASESIYVKYLILYYGDVEVYKVSTDDFIDYYGLTLFIQMLLYWCEITDVKKRIKEFLPCITTTVRNFLKDI